MDAITAKEARDFPKTNQGRGALVEPMKNDFLPSERRWTLWLLLGAVGFLLLIACLNVANLLVGEGHDAAKGSRDSRCSGRESSDDLRAIFHGELSACDRGWTPRHRCWLCHAAGAGGGVAPECLTSGGGFAA